ncbi:hypothetical protein [Phaeobacter sp. HF9A]|uniref:hypothetical protein n=1 Tax=Phaeobacter sp. HF9A TaxID=2721561 RepID=UPI0014318597|nr:hypothetical protein [Phaeobacter sp. HF9A]NIZ12098.1 hypothetical protein [Phaeobacter sp. HF9A]
MYHLVRTTALISAMATAALAAPKVASVEVEADLSAVETYEAAKVWAGLDTDLETEIAKLLVSDIAPEGEDGAEVKIDIDEIALANNFETDLGIGEWALSGDVDINTPDPSKAQHYTLTVTSDQTDIYYPEGVDPAKVTPDNEFFYHAMVAAFANNVASKLK